jgi:hypothetical protein
VARLDGASGQPVHVPRQRAVEAYFGAGVCDSIREASESKRWSS